MRTKRKLLGQHFIIDEDVFERECKYANVSKDDTVLEIGSGDGRLTRVIAKYAGKVIGIEKDPYLYALAKENVPENVELILGDVLDIDFPEFNKVVSNVPYSISSKIVEKLFRYNWDVAVLTFQKEFAERFLAKPGDRNYSRISILVNYFSEVEKLEIVKKGKFYPRPQVDSMMVRLVKKDVEDLGKDFWDFVNILFRHKKKTVKNALKDEKVYLDIPEKYQKKRVFQLSIDDLKELFEFVQ